VKPGVLVDRYRIERLLGEGGMGQVFEAFDPRLDRLVALKIVSSQDGADAVARVTREARAAARLTHTNAAAIFDVGEWNGNGYIAMELVRGAPMRRWIEDRATAVPMRIRWLLQLADALGAAHRLGIIHRDVKPENVLIDDKGQVKVVDFGVAKLVELQPHSAAHSTAPSSFCGTPRYMAPEQLVGGSVDGRTDQFAWGLVAFELLTRGHRSIAGREPGRPPSVRLVDVAPDVPLAVAEVITRALSSDKALRFSTMEEIARALAASAAGVLEAVPALPTERDTVADHDGSTTTTLGGPTQSVEATDRHVVTEPTAPMGLALATTRAQAHAHATEQGPTAKNPQAVLVVVAPEGSGATTPMRQATHQVVPSPRWHPAAPAHVATSTDAARSSGGRSVLVGVGVSIVALALVVGAATAAFQACTQQHPSNGPDAAAPSAGSPTGIGASAARPDAESRAARDGQR